MPYAREDSDLKLMEKLYFLSISFVHAYRQ